MHWDDLRYLLAIARHGTLSAAAKSLSVNHATVSRRLATAENELGVRLFDKLAKGYVATAAGEDVLAVANRVEEQVLSLDRRVLGLDSRLSGPLRLTTLDMLATSFCRELAAFTRKYPNIDLEVAVDNAPRNLSRREADVALRVGNTPPPHLVGRKVGTLAFALYASVSMLEQMAGNRSLSDFPWLGWDERLGARITEDWMRRHVPTANVVARMDSALVFRQAVIDGMGIGFLLCLIADQLPNLRRLRPVEPNFEMDLWLLTHQDMRGTARVKALTEHLAAGIRPYGNLMAGRDYGFELIETTD